ncbi:hypothetical protein K493DRAFT_352795 [Basidiobolus meristosporus CBS 931.73]|uniref:Uncharacterized protein n=1 Tax=Basidiobolus meristosporus CBS 931.73 TaxID=1314790 RepID=A0A1Y1Y943_9FUNG|nr:hypothetical protein K493DRAFT_352795 [Basidiobolus meristosporus CBS 931.73]|eukprot:ORX94084.1 hypothetical protein K493DRAFT_352795 [Basidiobolus meristosporus CBS 931.73]
MSSNKSRSSELLEVNPEGNSLTSKLLVAQPDASPIGVIDPTPEPSSVDKKTFKISPPSNLLERLQSFLPQIAEANQKLQTQLEEDPSSVDIENVEEEEGYIEMNLGLGVFEEKSEENEDSIIINPSDSVKAIPKSAIVMLGGSADSDSSEDEGGSESESDRMAE